jgi:hypothetical protein
MKCASLWTNRRMNRSCSANAGPALVHASELVEKKQPNLGHNGKSGDLRATFGSL